MPLSPVVESLIAEFETPKPSSRQGARFSVSRTISAIAVLYEKARNAVEFRAEHLVRRAAIERILKRRIMINGGSNEIAENLIIELLWARYIDSSLIDDLATQYIEEIVDRYLTVKVYIHKNNLEKQLPWDSLLGVASAEIEETLVSGKKREALNHFMYQAIRSKIHVPEHDETFINTQTFIAIERAYMQADGPLITYYLAKNSFPEWFTKEIPTNDRIAQFVNTLHIVHKHLKNPLGDSLFRYVRRQLPPFLLLRDLFTEEDTTIRTTIEDRVMLAQKLSDVAEKKYKEIGAKVRRAAVRSFIYIFLTKMLFALALEAPYDVYIQKRIDYIPLAINMLFPPVLMLFIAGLIAVPGRENTHKLVERVEKILFHFDEYQNESNYFASKPIVRRPLLTTVFSIFYIVTFTLTFFFIHRGLDALHFNTVSQVIFIFFVALVTFFAYRIRQSAREYEMLDRQGVLEPVMDFLFLPILRAGQFLSREIARLNIFIFFFDFILEAPLKVIFEVAEEWVRFVRTKKEEII